MSWEFRFLLERKGANGGPNEEIRRGLLTFSLHVCITDVISMAESGRYSFNVFAAGAIFYFFFIFCTAQMMQVGALK